MKKIKKILLAASLTALLCMLMTVVACADDAVPYSLNGNQSVTSSNTPCISYGLEVIAYQNQMYVAGIRGNALNFSSERFACAMNLSGVDSITVTRLPDAFCGSLYIGSESVSVGQRIKAGDIALMTYEEAPTGIGSRTSFDFRIENGTYDLTCNIFMIDELNYSPTVVAASYASLNIMTYRNVPVNGVLSAYDPEDDDMIYEIVKQPSRGRVVVTDRTLGTYSYIPDEGFTGDDSFCYVVQDKYGNYSSSAEVKVKVSSQSSTTVYSDMIDSGEYNHAIAMTENGLMNGIKVGNHYYFEADREVSRAEFVVTAMNAIGIKSVPDVTSTGFYDDSDISDEMKGYIALAYSKGYISGIKRDGNIYFRPNESVSLSEAAVIVSNMIGYATSKYVPAFSDSDDIPSWSSGAIESLYSLGILEFPDMTVSALESVTRGEMAKMLNKTIQVLGR